MRRKHKAPLFVHSTPKVLVACECTRVLVLFLLMSMVLLHCREDKEERPLRAIAVKHRALLFEQFFETYDLDILIADVSPVCALPTVNFKVEIDEIPTPMEPSTFIAGGTNCHYNDMENWVCECHDLRYEIAMSLIPDPPPETSQIRVYDHVEVDPWQNKPVMVMEVEKLFSARLLEFVSPEDGIAHMGDEVVFRWKNPDELALIHNLEFEFLCTDYDIEYGQYAFDGEQVRFVVQGDPYFSEEEQKKLRGECSVSIDAQLTPSRCQGAHSCTVKVYFVTEQPLRVEPS